MLAKTLYYVNYCVKIFYLLGKIPKDPNVQLFSAEQLSPVAGLSAVSVRKILGEHAIRLGLEKVGRYRYLPQHQVPALRELLTELGYTLPDPPVEPTPKT